MHGSNTFGPSTTQQSRIIRSVFTEIGTMRGQVTGFCFALKEGHWKVHLQELQLQVIQKHGLRHFLCRVR